MSLRERWLPHPLASLTLALIWLMLNGTLALGHVMLGALLGVALPALTRRLWPEQLSFRRFDLFLRLVGIVLWDIVVANIQVARLIIGPSGSLRPAFVVVPLAVSSPYAIATLAGIVTLTPGTVSADIGADRRTLLVHALDLDDEPALVAQVKRYESFLKEIIEC